jgi:gluconolactonase
MKLCSPRLAASLALLSGALACGDSAASTRADGGLDAGDAGVAPDANTDAAAAGDAATSPPPGDASTSADAGADAASGPDAGATIGVGGLRAALCTAASYPAPLAGASVRAAPLGSGGYDFVEGPVWVDATQKLYFSDMRFGNAPAPQGPASRIHALGLDGVDSVFVASSGSNGLALGPAGQLLAATHDTQGLSLYAIADGARESLALRTGGKRFNSPNDLVLRSDGSVYFTDPNYQLGARSSETGVTAAYRLPGLDATSAEPFETGLTQPNGIALSPDERTLYLSGSFEELYAYALADDGSVGARRVFAQPGAGDGLTVDCAGNVYTTVKAGVRVLSPAGDTLGTITLDEEPANVAFGGPEHRTLFITARTGVYSVELAVPGFPY